MGYKIHTSYNWYQTDTEKFLIKIYYISGIPFTFDEISEEEQNDPDILKEADNSMTYTPIDFYNSSFYLIDEEAHPCLFELDLENPEVLDELDSPY